MKHIAIPLADRNTEIARLFREGRRQQDIGDCFGITRQRVQQILKESGLDSSSGGSYMVARKKRAEKKRARKERREKYSVDKFGCSSREYRVLLDIGAAEKFRMQKANARKRGISFELKLWDWWLIWRKSGKWDERGTGQGYVMSRHGDIGPYSIKNVFINSARANNSKTKRNKSPRLPIGVTLTPSGYYRALRAKEGKHKYLGIYKTAEAAELAYKANKQMPNRIVR